MRKLAGIAFIAALTLAAVSTAAEAAVVLPKPPPPSNMSNGNGDPACVVDCLVIGNPHNPRLDCVRLSAGGGETLATRRAIRRPCKPSPEVIACGRKLGGLRRVTVRQVARIGARDQVRLVP